MTEKTEPHPLGIDSWISIEGPRWAVCEYYAILSIHKTEAEAETALEAIKAERAERERHWARLDPRQADLPL